MKRSAYPLKADILYPCQDTRAVMIELGIPDFDYSIPEPPSNIPWNQDISGYDCNIPEPMPVTPRDRGIYAFRCISTRNVYIGKSATLKSRRNAHRFLLRHSKHHCKAFQEAWNLYGADQFEYIVLDSFVEITHEKLCKLERRWLNEARRNGVILYNTILTKIPRTEAKLANMHLLTS